MAKPGKERPTQRDQDAMIVDELVRKLRPIDQALAAAPVSATGVRRMDRPAAVTRRLPRPRHAAPPPRHAGVWSRVGLGILLGITLALWPYGRACGWSLLFFLVAVAFVVVTGMWGAMFSWRSRRGAAHVLALGTIVWGVVLATHEVLPRVGHMTAGVMWQCAEPGGDPGRP